MMIYGSRQSCARQGCWIGIGLLILTLEGCTSVPMAPLVYGSKTIGGLDISTNATANPGVSVALGYKRDDIALVPTAVRSDSAAGDEVLQLVSGTDEKRGGKDEGGDGGVADKDALSVFGSFEGRGIGGTTSPSSSFNAMAANYFSTGIAAQNLAKSIGKAELARQLTRCFNAVREAASGMPANEVAAATRAGMEACSKAKED